MNRIADYPIRKAVAGDIEAMRALERRAAQKFRALGYDFCATAEVRDVEEHLRVLASGATFVAATENAIAGFAMAEPLGSEAHLIEIDVDPAQQGQVLALRLIAVGEGWVRLNSLDAMMPTTYQVAPWRASLCQRIGFVPLLPEPRLSGLHPTVDRDAAAGIEFALSIATRKVLRSISEIE